MGAVDHDWMMMMMMMMMPHLDSRTIAVSPCDDWLT
jgi:hypothetical protein